MKFLINFIKIIGFFIAILAGCGLYFGSLIWVLMGGDETWRWIAFLLILIAGPSILLAAIDSIDDGGSGGYYPPLPPRSRDTGNKG